MTGMTYNHLQSEQNLNLQGMVVWEDSPGVYRCPRINIIEDYGSTGMYAIITNYVT